MRLSFVQLELLGFLDNLDGDSCCSQDYGYWNRCDDLLKRFKGFAAKPLAGFAAVGAVWLSLRRR